MVTFSTSAGPSVTIRRHSRRRIINAEGEQQAAEKLVEAASALAARPEAMQLRYLNTIHDIAGERSSTIVFPVPIDLLRGFVQAADDSRRAGS
jgi:regulator of protease activity HflC (stomatin/prohibitin superfamily)